MEKYLRIVMCALFMWCVGCTSDTLVTPSDPDDPDDDEYAETKWIDEVLSAKYLYNEEYNSIVSKNYAWGYYDFFYGYLMALTTNVYDKKALPEGYGSGYSLFSYIDRTEVSRSATKASGDSSNGYGLFVVDLLGAYFNSVPYYVLTVNGVYPDSPLSDAGGVRGWLILKIDDVWIEDLADVNDSASALLSPASGESVSLYIFNGSGFETVELTSRSVENNPVLKCEMIDPTNKVGYLNYASFDMAFDDELLSALASLKSSGVEELILDLRLNLGGYVSSAGKLTSAIYNNSSKNSTVFQYYRLNDEIMATPSLATNWSGFTYDSSAGYFCEYLPVVDESSRLSGLNNKIYCLTTYDTASASEMVINSLRGLDFEVVLVGEPTRGKNVGMHVWTKEIGDYSYEMAPITFENFNARLEGGYSAGFEIDAGNEVDEYSNFTDFTINDPLISRALELITGTAQLPTLGTTRSASSVSLGESQNGRYFTPRSLGGAVKIVEE